MNLLRIFREAKAQQREPSQFALRPWETCQSAPWPKASRVCDHTGLIVGETHGNHEGHWAMIRNSVIGKYATEAEAQAAVVKRLAR